MYLISSNSPSNHTILLCHTNPVHVILHSIHEPSLLLRPDSIIFSILSKVSTISSLHISKPFQPAFSNFASTHIQISEWVTILFQLATVKRNLKLLRSTCST